MSGEVIRNNFKKYFEWAEKAFNEKEYNVAVTLYFKALVEICDLELWRKHRKTGSTHAERFRLIENTSPELYEITDTLFTYYRDTYSKAISEKTAKTVRKGVQHAIKISGIKEKD
jgi:hypothetical protein